MGSIVANSVSDYARRTANLPASSVYTMAGWVKLDDFSAAQNKYICFLDGTTDSGLILYQSEIYVLAGPGTTKFTAHPSSGAWLYVAITGNGTNTVGYWWTDNSGAPLLGDSETRSNSATGSIIEMAVCSRGGAEGAPGKYAFWKVWDHVLTQSELEAEMYSPTFLTGPDYYADANTGFADSETDIGPNGRNWTWNSITTDSDTPPVVFGLTPIVMTWTL